MLKKTIKYTDFDGKKQEEDFYFNLTKSEIMEKEATENGGFSDRLKSVVESSNGGQIMSVFRELIGLSYGERSADGKRFIKSKEISDEFMQTAAYDEFFMELVTDADAAIAFANGIMPPDLVEQAQKEAALPQDRKKPASKKSLEAVPEIPTEQQ